MLNTTQILELANVSVIYFHMKPNVIQWFMYEATAKYVIQGPECVKQEINPICAKFNIFTKIIKRVPFPKGSRYHFSQV